VVGRGGVCTATACSVFLAGAKGVEAGPERGETPSGLMEGKVGACATAERSSERSDAGAGGIGKPGISSGEGPEDIENGSALVLSV